MENKVWLRAVQVQLAAPVVDCTLPFAQPAEEEMLPHQLPLRARSSSRIFLRA